MVVERRHELLTTNKRNCQAKLYLDNKVEGWQYTPVCKPLETMQKKLYILTLLFKNIDLLL